MYEGDAPERETMTAEGLIEAVSDSVSRNVTESLSARLDGLDARLDGVVGRVDELSGAVAESVTKDELQAVSASLSEGIEQATLQAGEIGPVLTEEIGPVIIELVGGLLDALDSDGDGSSDVTALVTEIRRDVADVSATLLHPALTTPFTSYTVVEALLLLLVVGKFIDWWLRILRAGFSWMR